MLVAVVGDVEVSIGEHLYMRDTKRTQVKEKKLKIKIQEFACMRKISNEDVGDASHVRTSSRSGVECCMTDVI